MWNLYFYFELIHETSAVYEIFNLEFLNLDWIFITL